MLKVYNSTLLDVLSLHAPIKLETAFPVKRLLWYIDNVGDQIDKEGIINVSGKLI